MIPVEFLKLDKTFHVKNEEDQKKLDECFEEIKKRDPELESDFAVFTEEECRERGWWPILSDLAKARVQNADSWRKEGIPA